MKRPRELEAEGVFEQRQRAAPQRPSQAGGRSFIPRPREATREAPRDAITTSLDQRHPTFQPRGCAEERRPSPLPRGGIKIVEGCETRPPRVMPTTRKGKGKAEASPKLLRPMEEATSSPYLEALMSDLTLVEEQLLKDPREEFIIGLVSV